MKCVCRRMCQQRVDSETGNIVKDGGYIRTFQEDEIWDFPKAKKPPLWFEAIEGETYALDFETAEKDELLEAKWTFKAISQAAKDLYGEEMNNRGEKIDLVEQFLDIRFRAL